MKKKKTKAKPKPKPESYVFGRPTDYKPEYCQMIVDYFERPFLDKDGNPENPPLILYFAHSIGTCHETLLRWRQKHPDFRKAYRKAKQLQTAYMMSQAATKRYDGGFVAKMLVNLYGWKSDSSKVDINAKVETVDGVTAEERQALKQLAKKNALRMKVKK